MRPIYLSFTDEATWAKLSAEDKYVALTPVVVGVIEGAEGFHINLLGELPEELAEYEVFPATPSCVYGGWSPDEMASQSKAVN